MGGFSQWFTEYGLWASYVLIILGLAVILVFTAIQLSYNLRKSSMSVLGLLGIAILFLIAYSGANEVTDAELGPQMTKLIGSGLITLYILAGFAILGIILGEIWSFIK